MTCVTLKRPVEVLGSPHMMEHEPMTKKRCGMSLFPTTPPGPGSSVGLSGVHSGSCGQSSSSSSYRHSFCGSPVNFVRSSKRAKRKLDVDQYSILPTPLPISPFESATPPLETGKLVAQLEQELKRLHRRRALFPGESSTASSPTISHNNTSVKDQPLFTLKQVTIVCKRMMKEREELVRSEYDKILTVKLAEQYDTFVKFSHDQIERRLAESAFSYVS